MSLYKFNVTVKVDDEDDKLEKENDYILTSLRGG